MELTLSGSTIVFSGVLDEKTSIATIRTYVEQALSQVADGVIFLNFGAVKRANSLGILAWAKFIEASPYRFAYVDTPEWLIEQFNLCGLLKEGSRVESLQASFYCPENDSHRVLTLSVGKDIPVQDDYSDFEISRKTTEGLLLEADFEPAEYFNFLARNAKRKMAAR